jgi:hypothetical protein
MDIMTVGTSGTSLTVMSVIVLFPLMTVVAVGQGASCTAIDRGLNNRVGISMTTFAIKTPVYMLGSNIVRMTYATLRQSQPRLAISLMGCGMINRVAGRAVNGVSGPTIGNRTLNLGVRTTMTDVAIQAAIAVLSGNIRQVAISTILCRKKSLIVRKGMIDLTVAINTEYWLTQFAFSNSLLYIQQLAIVAGSADRKTEAAVLLDSVL